MMGLFSGFESLYKSTIGGVLGEIFGGMSPDLPDPPKAPDASAIAQREAEQEAALQEAQRRRQQRRGSAAANILTTPLGTQSQSAGTSLLMGG